MVATGCVPRPTRSRDGRPSFAASIAAGPDPEAAVCVEPPAVELLELPVVEVVVVVPELPVVPVPELPVVEVVVVVPELPIVPVPELPELPVVPVLLEALVLPEPVVALAVAVDPGSLPPHAASASAPMQQAVLRIETWNLNKNLHPVN